ncbi:hypothetical protein J1N35_034398 [Gossypium stocksii]|uniref:Uncharacterized protein n=1 Tax=Gossypium stocksii TaxID=47602 RepID=A0A9D3ZQ63_9ROSI|nr:hypothetical protein J1N35_034398 [Gossypium stocksii]
MGDILIHIMEQNRWLTPTPLSNMFKRFPPPSEEGANEEEKDEEEEKALIVPLDYEQVFRLDRHQRRVW